MVFQLQHNLKVLVHTYPCELPSGVEGYETIVVVNGDWDAATTAWCGLNAMRARAQHNRVLKAIQDATQAESEEEFTCRGCGRPEAECSRNPCDPVKADREA